MASERLDAYLRDLTAALVARGVWDERTIEEARTHLADAVEAGLRRGLPRDAAEREAVAAFGAPEVVAARAAADRSDRHDCRSHPVFDRLLTASCGFTLLATSFLTLSVIVLRPPRFDYNAWFLIGGFFLAQSALTLMTIIGPLRGRWVRWALIAGGVAIASTGAWWVRQTLSGAHFEGFALILGSWVAIQGMLTIVRLLPVRGPWLIVRAD
jgi:hypothetical protein